MEVFFQLTGEVEGRFAGIAYRIPIPSRPFAPPFVRVAHSDMLHMAAVAFDQLGGGFSARMRTTEVI